MASVLLPLPPFWVAKTMVYMEVCFKELQALRIRCTELHRLSRCRAILAQDVPARFLWTTRGSRSSEITLVSAILTPLSIFHDYRTKV